MKNIVQIFFFVIVFMFGHVNAQELPPIENFTPKIYKAENQNWAISQSENKFIYVANNIGLLEYNGSVWKLYETPNQTIIRSVMAIGDRIYTGCYMEFGFWERNKYNELKYTSLSKNIESSMIEDEQFWNIISIDDFIVFQSLNRIYSYNTTSKSFNIIESETTLTKMVKVDNTIYFQKLNLGIFKIENGKEKLFSDDEVLKSNRIINIFKIDGKFIFETNQRGFFEFYNGELTKWDIPANDYLSQLTTYSSIRLKDGSFAIGTISNGVVYINKEGTIDYNINQNNGLSNNTILSIFEDIDDNIWLGLDNGVDCINRASPFKEYNDKLGRLGAVHAIKVHNNKLYLGTNQGLYVRPINSNNEFEFIEGTNGQVWYLNVYDDTLFCGHDLGIFAIDNKTANKISNHEGTWIIKQLPEHKNLLLIGTYNGLGVLEKVNNLWRYRNKIEGFDISSKFFEIIENNQVFVSHEYKGVFKLDLDDEFKKVLKISKDTVVGKGLNSSLIKYNSEILYAYEKGIYKYDKDLKVFKKDTLLSQSYNFSPYVSGKLVFTNDKLWSFSERNICYITPGLLSNVPKINRIPLSNSLRKSVTGYEYIYPLENEKYLLGTASGYIIIDLKKVKKQSYSIRLNSVYNSGLNTEKKLQDPESFHEYKNKRNNFEFTYSIAEYDKYLETEYQYRLDGNFNKWSKWSKSSTELFKNLPYGDYTFNVRGRVGNQLTDNIAIYKFTIEKPWYVSNLFIFIYVSAAVFLFILINNLYKRKYKRQEEKLLFEAERELELKELEKDQELMSIRNEQLKQDIDNKNRELAISTMSLIKKNEFLNSIKEELKVANVTTGLNPVIKIIDKNLNNTDDWKFFEEAFNNADKDFLKKVKSRHSALTSNDLRLCAYLRLNLSSKEMAPLLNISVRSVEVKRYRLRKKMNLERETSLTDYILDL